MEYPNVKLTAPTPELNHQLWALKHYRRTYILDIPHWAAIPELKSELAHVNADERKVARELSKRPDNNFERFRPIPAPHRIETGDLVRHAEYGEGEVLGMQYSAKLHHLLVYVRYQDGEKRWSMEGDLEYIPEAQP